MKKVEKIPKICEKTSPFATTHCPIREKSKILQGYETSAKQGEINYCKV
jgi:hypothetical protein